MIYYVVVKDAYDTPHKYGVIKSELLTEAERKSKASNIPDRCFIRMEINRSHTMRNFGVRLVQMKYRPLYDLPSMF